MNVLPYWGFTNISNHRNIYGRPSDLALGICAPLFEVLSLPLRVFKSRFSASVLQGVTLWHCDLLHPSYSVLYASLDYCWSTFRYSMMTFEPSRWGKRAVRKCRAPINQWPGAIWHQNEGLTWIAPTAGHSPENIFCIHSHFVATWPIYEYKVTGLDFMDGWWGEHRRRIGCGLKWLAYF